MLLQDHCWALNVLGRARVWADLGAPRSLPGTACSAQPLSVVLGSCKAQLQAGHLSTAPYTAKHSSCFRFHAGQVCWNWRKCQVHRTVHVFLCGTPGQSKKDPLWGPELFCICITSEGMKLLRQFYTGLALSKGCCAGKWFGRLWQNQLCSLWPHSGIPKPWETSLAAVTATIAEIEKTELQDRSAKAKDNHIHAYPSLPPGTQLITSWAPQLHPSSVLSPVVGATSYLNPPTLEKPWAASGLLFSSRN